MSKRNRSSRRRKKDHQRGRKGKQGENQPQIITVSKQDYLKTTLEYAQSEAQEFIFSMNENENFSYGDYRKILAKAGCAFNVFVIPPTMDINCYLFRERWNVDFKYPSLDMVHNMDKENKSNENVKYPIMTLTPMEIQSHIIPIRDAKGVVGVGGLGFGYYLWKIMDKPEITEIHVFEIEQAFIDAFIHARGHHPKITFHNKDVLKVRGMEFDYFYMDIYTDMGMGEMIGHYTRMHKYNNIKGYYAWTQEMMFFFEQNFVALYFKTRKPKTQMDHWLMYGMDYFDLLEAVAKERFGTTASALLLEYQSSNEDEQSTEEIFWGYTAPMKTVDSSI